MSGPGGPDGRVVRGAGAAAAASAARVWSQKPLAIVVTVRQRGDSPQFTTVLEAIAVPTGCRSGTSPFS